MILQVNQRIVVQQVRARRKDRNGQGTAQMNEAAAEKFGQGENKANWNLKGNPEY